MSKRSAALKANCSRKKQNGPSSSRSSAHPFPQASKNGASTNPDRPLSGKQKNGGFMRSKATITRLNMYKKKPDYAKMKIQPSEPARIAPDRRWFQNSRVMTQTKLDEFREAMTRLTHDPYAVVLKRAKLPTALFDHSGEVRDKKHTALLRLESFDSTFGQKATRKRPKLEAEDLSAMLSKAESATENYDAASDMAMVKPCVDNPKDEKQEEIFKKGTSKRIWGELYKVIDSSDIVVEVFDARDPMGTRCRFIEDQMKNERKHKHLILLMNKIDLVPNWVVERWVKLFSKDYPTVAFRAHQSRPYGQTTLLNLLRQFVRLMKDHKHVSVGFIGYPNVGKSSVINSLKGKKVCKTAPIPGETKVWQYISLTDKIHLVDCPGVIAMDGDIKDDLNKVLRGVVRAERLENPEDFIEAILGRVGADVMIRKYKLPRTSEWDSAEQFLTLLALRIGRLLKGGEPDLNSVARTVIYDWQRGRIPFFALPPGVDPTGSSETKLDGGINNQGE